MTKYVIRRLIQAIPVLFGITIVVYGILLAAPGGPTARFANNPRVTLADREAFKKAWGLDQPIPVQYCRWLGACNPDVADKVRGGKIPAVGALVGAVMKATRGQADAAAVRAILLERLGVSE